MKKTLSILTFMVMTVTLLAQTTLTFVGRDRTGNDYVRLSSVSVYDLDQLWHQIIEYPDTTLVLYVNGTVGVETMCTSSLQMQNNPNPFDGTTDVILCTPYAGDVTMEIADVNGRAVVGANDYSPLPTGTHQFRLTLSAPGTYVLTARQNGRTVSVKMVNAGNGGGDGIEYIGSVETVHAPSLQLKSNTRRDGHYPFHNWDRMRYTGYAVVDDVEIESETVEKAQNGSETIPLKFDVARPEVVTNDATNVAATAAMLHGEVTADNNANVTERGFCYGTAPNPTYSSSPRVEAGDGLGTFDVTLNGLAAATTYYTRAYAKNVVGVSYGTSKAFRTNDTLPEVVTTEPDQVTATSFVSGGEVLTANGAAVTVRGICWNTTGAPIVSDSHTTNGSGLGTFTSTATGLTCSTTYYVRAYATNSVGTAYGLEYSVTTTQELAQVVTSNVSSITDNTAVCSGEVIYDGCSEVTARGVCWNTTGAPTLDDSYTTDGNGLGDFTSQLSGLNYATTYYVRAYATNGVGTAYGEELSFTTNPILPTVTTMEVTDVMATTFVCGGDVTNDGGAEVTIRGICWSTNQNPTIADNYTTDGSGLGTFTSNVTGLSCGTTYYVRAYATNSVGTAYGEEYQVTSTDTLPVVEILTAQIYATSIIAQSEVLTENCAAVTTRGVCWSTTGTPTVADSHTTNGNGLGNYTSTISGLIPNTTYYVRTYATNSAGTEYGQVYTYHTMDTLPVVTTSVPSNVTVSTFTSGGEVLAMNSDNLIAFGICWNTTGAPSIDDSHTTLSGGLGIFTSNVTGLDCGTTYYVRAYAINNVGTAYGEEYSVTTLSSSLPEVTIATAIIYNGVNAVIQAEVLTENCAAVTSRGVCWSTSHNPTLEDSHTVNGEGIGAFNDTLTNLEIATNYYIRAYATNELGTAYSEEAQVVTPDYPTVTTSSVTNITAATATSGGSITSDGGATVTARGVCWSTTPNPTIADSHTTDGTGTGSFSSSLTGLTSGTTYYVRAYATNSVGTAYGEEYSFTTLALPTVITTSVTAITSTTATSGGNVISDGGATVTACGVCWSTSQTPTIADDHTTDGNGTGSFTSSLTGLTPNTTYYVRAYATNNVGTSYGDELTFTTLEAPCGEFTFTDIDGNPYNTVQIGTQCWMKENLRTTKYADGTSIEQGDSTSTAEAYWYYPNNDATNKSTYGLLYNWKAVMRNSSSSSANLIGVQGVCPTGWHVPSDAEFTQLTDYVSSQSQYVCGSDNAYIAKALAGTTGWSSNTGTCAVGKTPSQNNSTGFSALPAGLYAGVSNYFFGQSACFWSATENGSSAAWRRMLLYYYAGVSRTSDDKTYGFSVRCLRDEGGSTTSQFPTITTSSVTDITSTTATSGGSITSDGGATVTARGVCWNTTGAPSVADSHTTDGNGTGSFTSSLTGLTANTTYYVRAYATNSVGTSYGEEVCFATLYDACQGVTTLTDCDGNTYNTVQIGTQCWMKENLRTTKYADGTSISQGSSSTSTTTAYWYYPDNSSSNKTTYGLLYNWKAVMRNSSSSDANPSGVQGVCPTGWHVPSDEEWKQMEMAVGMSQSDAGGTGYRGNIAAKFSGNTGWASSTIANAAGNLSASNRNITGFSALPAGRYTGNYGIFGNYAYFWSATELDSSDAWLRTLNYNSAGVYRGDSHKYYGYSVRCLRD